MVVITFSEAFMLTTMIANSNVVRQRRTWKLLHSGMWQSTVWLTCASVWKESDIMFHGQPSSFEIIGKPVYIRLHRITPS